MSSVHFNPCSRGVPFATGEIVCYASIEIQIFVNLKKPHRMDTRTTEPQCMAFYDRKVLFKSVKSHNLSSFFITIITVVAKSCATIVIVAEI